MMVAFPAVSRNLAFAQESDGAEEAQTPADDEAAAADDASTDATPSRARKGKRPAAAKVTAQDPLADTGFGGPAQVNHLYQTGLTVMPGVGYRLIAPYKENQYCADSSGIKSKRVCAGRVPFFLDIQLAFGATKRLDVIIDLRLGLETDPLILGGREVGIFPGLRFWIDQDVSLKFYTTLQFMYSYLDLKGLASSSDLGVRNANGLMYDPIRNVGFFVQFGESIGFSRWFSIAVDVGLGVQIRFP
jgi:hypothetical protein